MTDKTESKQHTPTPWHYDGEFIRTGDTRFSLSARPLEVIAEVKDSENWEANAGFIVRAVNSHEALLKIAKSIYDYDCKMGRLPKVICEQLGRAIAQSEGK